ncbi:serine/threonine-protein kinase [Nocardia wallacei]|uniref:serine/threonine-protein kinase n=1 Tax=Nocardia wallacei TaxID=480035 RepID=UPI0024569156|nr:serine/threonine-protein kinase [Nocardia wallacei]
MTTITDTDGRQWHYDETTVIGKGAAGIVYAGESSEGVPVAVKVVDIGTGVGAAEIHGREVGIGAKVAAAEQHDHLVVNYATARSERTVTVVMPRARTNLEDYQKERDLKLSEKVEIIRQIGRGLKELADIGIVHRDLRPGNVLLFDDRWCLADFGISRALAEGTAQWTRKGEGSSFYMAPEYAETWSASPQTDQYALGVIAYELLTGRLPFESQDIDELRREHREAAPPVMPEDIPHLLQLFVLRLLDKDPALRFADSDHVLAALDDALQPLDTDQQRLSQAVLAVNRNADAVRETEALTQRKLKDLDDTRSRAIADLDYLVRRVIATIKPVLGDELTDRTSILDDGSTWIIGWRDYVLILGAVGGTGIPEIATYPLVIGTLTVTRGDPRGQMITAGPPTANLLFVPTATSGRWIKRLWSFQHGPPEMGLSPAQEIWKRLDEVHAPGPKQLPYVYEDSPLTVDAILEPLYALLENDGPPGRVPAHE